MIAEESINEIREKANLVEIVSNYITLKKAGRSYKGICPFHKEKTPSFMVDSQKQLFYCFGCSEGGNVFNFIMKIENLDFGEAAEFLARTTGVRLNYASAGKNTRLQGKRERYFQINKEASDFYHYLLMKAEQGLTARQYLKSRAYGKNAATVFKLGYAPPNMRSLTNLLIKKGYQQEEIIALDLAHLSSGQVKDRYFNRLIFPIEDVRGNIVGFGGRVLDEKDKPKYLNSAETPVFHKSKQFYGLNLAKNEIVKQDKAIIVEGYTDVISLYRADIKNTVATLGTALTLEHVQTLGRYCSSAIMLYDSDEAGLKAAMRSVEFANQTNLELLVAILPDGDPADFVVNNGSEELNKVLAEAMPVVGFCIERIVSAADMSSPKKRVAVVNKAFELIRNQNNSILEQEYLQILAKLTSLPVQNLVVEYRKKISSNRLKNKNTESISTLRALSTQEKAENMLLSILIDSPALLPACLKIITPNDLISDSSKNIIRLIEQNAKKDLADLVSVAEDDTIKRHISALNFISKPDNLEQAVIEVANKIKDSALKRQISEMKEVLEKTNPIDNREQYDKLFKHLIELEAKRRDLVKVS